MGAALKITQEEIVDRQTVLHVELEDDDLAPYIDRAYRRVAQRVSIPGFRKGKAPRHIVERFVGKETLVSDSLEDILPEATQRAISEQGLETAGTPRIELAEVDPVTINATVALTPEVDLGPYREIRVAEEDKPLTEEEVQNGLEELRNGAASWEPVDRPVQLGDMVTTDLVGSIDGAQFAEQKDSVLIIEAGGVVPLPGFAEKLEGAAEGQPAEFDLAIPEDYADASIAGKDAHFQVSVRDIKERLLPELDDEFAKGVGDGYDSLDALREFVEQQLNEEAEKAKESQHRESTLEELLKVAEVKVPPLLIENEVERMVDRRDRFVDRLNIRKDDYLRFTGKSEDEIHEEMHEHAVERVSRSYALTTLAEEESLEVADAEVDEKIEEMVKSGAEESGSLKDLDMSSEVVRESVRETLLLDKAVDRLIEIAKGQAPQLVAAGAEEEEGDEGDVADTKT